MPLCIVAKEHTVDPKGANNPDDFVQVLRGEVVKVPAGDALILANYVAPIADSDIGEVVTCKCGRMFSSEMHAHFTQAQFGQELLAANDLLATLEEGTAGHTEQAEKVEEIERRIAAEKKQHRPIETKPDAAEAPTTKPRKPRKPRKPKAETATPKE